MAPPPLTPPSYQDAIRLSSKKNVAGGGDEVSSISYRSHGSKESGHSTGSKCTNKSLGSSSWGSWGSKCSNGKGKASPLPSFSSLAEEYEKNSPKTKATSTAACRGENGSYRHDQASCVLHDQATVETSTAYNGQQVLVIPMKPYAHPPQQPTAISTAVGTSFSEVAKLPSSAAGAAAAGAATSNSGKPIVTKRIINAVDSSRILYTPADDEWLSAHLCVLRRQIEAFAASASDVEAKRRCGGNKHAVVISQVGIRCIHCKSVPRKERAKGAVLYPSSISQLHQAVRNFQRHHFGQCRFIPDSIRKEFEEARTSASQSKSGSNDYWTTSSIALGLLDSTEGKNGIRLNVDVLRTSTTCSAAAAAKVNSTSSRAERKNGTKKEARGTKVAARTASIGVESKKRSSTSKIKLSSSSLKDDNDTVHCSLSALSGLSEELLNSRNRELLLLDDLPLLPEALFGDDMQDETVVELASLSLKPEVEIGTCTRSRPVGGSAPITSTASTSPQLNKDHLLDLVILTQCLATKMLESHASGVSIHSFHPKNKVTLESIVEAIENASTGNSKSSTTTAYTNSKSISSHDHVRKDLQLLGRALFWQFTGLDLSMDPAASFSSSGQRKDADTTFRSAKRECIRVYGTTERMMGEGVPTPLLLLVENLLQVPKSPCVYHDAQALIEDLQYLTSRPRVFDTDDRCQDLTFMLHKAMASIQSVGMKQKAIKLNILGRDDVNMLMSEVLQSLPRLSLPLSDAVYDKTGGDPMSTIRFVQSLSEEGLIHYSAENRQWTWILEEIRSKDLTDSVATLVTSKLLMLDEKARHTLMIASCFGSRFNMSLMTLLYDGRNRTDIETSLNTASREGLICWLPKNQEYKFSHSKIQVALYEMNPERQRNALHLDIGKKLWSRASPETLEKIIFVVVDQIGRGSQLLLDPSERVEFAKLCLKAGEKAMAKHTFVPAMMYLLQGSAHLDHNHWSTHYYLSLRTFGACAKAQYILGNNEGAMLSLSYVFVHGKRLLDKLDAYCTLLQCLANSGKINESIQKGLEVCNELGEDMNTEPIREFGIVQTMLADTTSAAHVLAKEEMLDLHKLTVMRILYILHFFAYQGNQDVLAVVVARMVQLSLKYGVCRYSSLGFGAFASYTAAFGKFDEAQGFARLSFALLERFRCEHICHRVLFVLNSSVYCFTEPLGTILPKYQVCYEKSMSVGDTTSSLSSAHTYIIQSLQGGKNLHDLVEVARSFVDKMKERSSYVFYLTLPPLQAMLNLIGGESCDPTLLDGSGMKQDEILAYSKETSQTNIEMLVLFFRMWLAYLFSEYDLAAKLLKRLNEISQVRPMRSETIVPELFCTGLIAVVMGSRNESSEAGMWRAMAAETIKQFEVWASASDWNFSHKLCLLKAETLFYLDGDIDGALSSYSDAIRFAEERGYVCDLALACERAGSFYQLIGANATAIQMFNKSHKSYVEWGATRKAHDVLQRSLECTSCT